MNLLCWALTLSECIVVLIHGISTERLPVYNTPNNQEKESSHLFIEDIFTHIFIHTSYECHVWMWVWKQFEKCLLHTVVMQLCSYRAGSDYMIRFHWFPVSYGGKTTRDDQFNVAKFNS